MRMLRAKLRMRANIPGLDRMRDRSSSMVTSRMWCEVVSMPQWAPMASAARVAVISVLAT